MEAASVPTSTPQLAQLPNAPPVPMPALQSDPAPAGSSSSSADVADGADSVCGDLGEVDTIDDLIVRESYVLDDSEPPPSDDDDGDSQIDDDASSIASSAMMDAGEPLPEPEPPAEDHSIQQITMHAEAVFSVSVNAAQPELFATGGGDDVGYLWRAGQKDPAFKLEGHSDTISALGFSADGTMLASAGLDGTIRVWNVATGALCVTLEGPTQGINWLR